MRNLARRLDLALYRIDAVYYLNENKKKISDAELSVMYALDDGEPHSQKEISEQWLVPKTTVNSIVRRWEKDGLLIQIPIPGRRREKHIILTESGREYASRFMGFLYRAENRALQKTIERYGDSFVEIIEFYGKNLKDAFDEDDGEEKNL